MADLSNDGAPAEARDILNSHEAARYLGAHGETIRRLARRGGIPAFKIGKDWRFSRAALREWMQANPAQAQQPLVLVVDDERSVRESVSIALEAEQFRVAMAATGDDALELTANEQPHIVVLDLLMPGMTGGAALKQLRARYPNIPVIVTTGYPDGELMSEALESAPFTLLAKPVPIKTLVAVIRGMIAGSRM
ncbi:MAG: response regulator, partial [Kiritimatiellia bacterium]|nr:response regulator [Kiritimatiellia bacterium]